MKVLVLGASGATGRLLVVRLVELGHRVKAVVRETAAFPEGSLENGMVETVRGNVDSISVEEMARLLADCDAAASCLGHTINLRGLFGKPRRLVRDAVAKIAEASRKSGRPIRFALMSTTAYTDSRRGEPVRAADEIVSWLLRYLLPPHADNLAAADYLVDSARVPSFGWVAVRPDSLVDEDEASHFEATPWKKRSPVFDPGTTSRINVARFMADLLTDEDAWAEWKFGMPVIYDRE